MATVKNVTPDALSIGSVSAPPVNPGDEVEIRDENFVGKAWPKSTWDLVKKPGKPYVDASTEDAHLFIEPEQPAPADTPEESA
jgi:hypothetical protein